MPWWPRYAAAAICLICPLFATDWSAVKEGFDLRPEDSEPLGLARLASFVVSPSFNSDAPQPFNDSIAARISTGTTTCRFRNYPTTCGPVADLHCETAQEALDAYAVQGDGTHIKGITNVVYDDATATYVPIAFQYQIVDISYEASSLLPQSYRLSSATPTTGTGSIAPSAMNKFKAAMGQSLRLLLIRKDNGRYWDALGRYGLYQQGWLDMIVTQVSSIGDLTEIVNGWSQSPHDVVIYDAVGWTDGNHHSNLVELSETIKSLAKIAAPSRPVIVRYISAANRYLQSNVWFVADAFIADSSHFQLSSIWGQVLMTPWRIPIHILGPSSSRKELDDFDPSCALRPPTIVVSFFASDSTGSPGAYLRIVSRVLQLMSFTQGAIRFMMVVYNHIYPELIALRRALSLETMVDMVGRDQLSRVMSITDVIIDPSPLYGTNSFIYPDALDRHIPIVTFRTCASSEWIREGDKGYVTVVEDISIDDMAEAVTGLLNDSLLVSWRRKRCRWLSDRSLSVSRHSDAVPSLMHFLHEAALTVKHERDLAPKTCAPRSTELPRPLSQRVDVVKKMNTLLAGSNIDSHQCDASDFDQHKLLTRLSSYNAHHSDESERLLRPPVSLLCAVYTIEPYHDQIEAIMDTWGEECDLFRAYSNASNPTMGIQSIAVPGNESYLNMWRKVQVMLASVFDLMDQRGYDWVVVGGDDMYVHVPNLKEYLESADSWLPAGLTVSDPLYIGR
jgi:glycosyltransferase involved in cell wall biosynthesis